MSDGSTSRRRRRKSSHARSPARRPNWRALLLIAFSLGFGTLVVLRTIKLESPSAVRTAAVALESASYEDLPAISAQARGAFAENPLDARAMRILAIVAERQGGNEHTTDLMRTAWRLNRRDDGLDRWLYGQAMRKRQYAEAFVHVDAILRRRPDDLPPVFPVLLAALNDPAALQPMAERLVYRPEWRSPLLLFLSDRAPDTAFALMAATRKLGSPPDQRELSYYLRRLVDHERYEDAYDHWRSLRSSGGDVAGVHVSNGDFTSTARDVPFGWDFEDNVLGNIERADAYGRDENALRIDYDGSSQARLPQQLIVLPPGRYRLSGDALTATPYSAGKLEWTVVCMSGEFLARSPTVDTNFTWRRFAVDFEVPGDGCRAQWLRLKTIRADQRSTVETWYDKLAVTPLSGG